jgi:DNA-binding beta-propeller fold protein YncE
LELRWQFGSTRRLGAGSSLLYRPLHCSLTPDRSLLYVVDSGNARVVVLRADSGQFVSAFGARGVGAAQFHNPTSLAFAFSGTQRHVWVADSGNQRVICFDAHDPLNHRPMRQLGRTGEAGHNRLSFNQPSGLAVHAGRLYVADAGNNRVQIFDESTGTWLQTLRGAVSSVRNASEPRMLDPRLIAIDPARQLAFVSDANQFVSVFSLASLSFRGKLVLRSHDSSTGGSSSSSSGDTVNIPANMSSAFPACVAVDPIAGLLYATDAMSHRITVYRSLE